MENPEALGFHQEQMEMTEYSTENPRIGFVSNLILLTRHISFEIFQSQKKKKENNFLLQVSVIIQKFKIQSRYFNVSGNIIK